MKRTGIITFHNVQNFGAFIQAWSLVQAVQTLGKQAEVIDYRPAGLETKFRRTNFRRFIPSLGRWRMRRFMTKNLPLSSVCSTAEDVDRLVESGRYESLICGSDQVWLVDGSIPFDRTYFLGIGRNCDARRISYAASCGNINTYGECTALVQELLSCLHRTSVRDLYSLSLIRSLGFSNVSHVVDPSLLADFSGMISDRPHWKSYLAVVGGMTPESCRLARRIADSRGLDLVAVGTRCAGADRESRFVNAGEWVNWIAHSEGVLTSLFHGAAVSIALRKPFMAIDSSGRAFKLLDLLSRFQLMERFSAAVDGEYKACSEFIEFDYSASEALISREVEASWNYLREALNG